MEGKVVRELKVSGTENEVLNLKLGVRNEKPGNYLIRITGTNEIYSAKVLISEN